MCLWHGFCWEKSINTTLLYLKCHRLLFLIWNLTEYMKVHFKSGHKMSPTSILTVCSLEALSFLIKLVHWTLNFGPEMASELLVLSQIMFMGPPPQIRFFCVHRENVHSQQWTWKTAFECQTLHNSEAQTYNEEEQEERGVCDWRWTLNKYQDIWSWSWVFWCLRS